MKKESVVVAAFACNRFRVIDFQITRPSFCSCICSRRFPVSGISQIPQHKLQFAAGFPDSIGAVRQAIIRIDLRTRLLAWRGFALCPAIKLTGVDEAFTWYIGMISANAYYMYHKAIIVNLNVTFAWCARFDQIIIIIMRQIYFNAAIILEIIYTSLDVGLRVSF